MLDGYRLIVVGEYRCSLRGLLFHSVYYSLDGVGASLRTRCISKVGNVEWFGVHLGAVAIEVILHVVILVSLNTPRAIHSTRSLYGYESAVEPIRDSLCHDSTEGGQCGNGKCNYFLVHI